MKKMNLICSCNNSNPGIRSSNAPLSKLPVPGDEDAPGMRSSVNLTPEQEVYKFIKHVIKPDIIKEFDKFSGEQFPITAIVKKSQSILSKMYELTNQEQAKEQVNKEYTLQLMDDTILKYDSLIKMVNAQTETLQNLLEKGENSKIAFKDSYTDNLEKLLKMINEYEILLNYIESNFPHANDIFMFKMIMDATINESDVIITTINKMVNFSVLKKEQVAIRSEVHKKLEIELSNELNKLKTKLSNAADEVNFYNKNFREIMEKFSHYMMGPTLFSINDNLNETKNSLENLVKQIDGFYARLKQLLENVLKKDKANTRQEDVTEIATYFNLWWENIKSLIEQNIANKEIYDLEHSKNIDLRNYFVTKLNTIASRKLNDELTLVKQELQPTEGGNKKKYNTKKGKEKKYHTKKNKIKMKRKERKTKTKMKKRKRVSRRK